MYETFSLLPGVTLRCVSARKFKQGYFSLRLLRPMRLEESALNALFPAILLQGCRTCPDLQQITQRLDDLYGAGIHILSERIGDLQSSGLCCSFIDDRFALPGDAVLQPMLELLLQLLLDPVTEDGGFSRAYTKSERHNLLTAVANERSDKQAYAQKQLLQYMCRGDSTGIPRLGTLETIRSIDHRNAYAHYRKVLRESPMELFYVGSAQPQQIMDILLPRLQQLQRSCLPLPRLTPFAGGEPSHHRDSSPVAQSRLVMGFVTPITVCDPRFAAMRILNLVLGEGMTSKLFLQVREEQALCYQIDSSYTGSKGLVLVDAGIDGHREQQVRQAVLRQLQACCDGEITQRELEAAREALLTGLRTVPDHPGSIEGFCSTYALLQTGRTLEDYRRQVLAVTLADVVAAARTVTYHSSYFLEGAEDE